MLQRIWPHRQTIRRAPSKALRSQQSLFTTKAKSRKRVSSLNEADGKTLQDFIVRSHLSAHPIDYPQESIINETSAMNFPSNLADMDGNEEQTQTKNFYIETYGCQMNTADSEIVHAILVKNGYQLAKNPEDADVILLNTCAIRENAESKIWNRLEQWRQIKVKLLRHKSTRNHLPTVGVLGCMAERLKTKLLECDKMVDLVVGPDAYRDLPNLLQVVRGGQSAVNVQLSLDETYAGIVPVRSDPSNPSAFVSIMRGCNNMCSYCIVPFTRGRERSCELESIISEVKSLRDQGVKEIMLLGQNVNSYHDKQSQQAQEKGRAYVSANGFKNMFKARNATGFRFVDVLDHVSQVDSEMRIRFTSPHPKDFPDDVLDLIQERHNICNSVHMPAQSGSTTVLERMRRGYSREAYLALAENMRTRIPGVSISSDFITGFCGETEEEHQDTLTLIQRVCFDQAFMFTYSLRAKTHAAHRMEDNVPQEVKLRRLKEIIDEFSSIVTRKNLAENSDRLHVVLVQGASRRSTDENPKLTGLTDTNKRCVFPDVMMPTSLQRYRELKSMHCAGHSGSQDLNHPDGLSPIDMPLGVNGVRAAQGDYVLVRIHEAGRATLHATPIARTTLAEVNAVVRSDLLGARPHSFAEL
uniref:CDK5 regulatory subunitassociated protein 1 putativ n=1 Tax=Albugo laibachii Nc14 TaxID=890382 RepID=F0WAV6_9STRA|nr:CDK5 regulatory subunitassociated protein 1 putativ [Albugo laibachii Nc14]CCA18448.1 CDK5 regulatory subunitassociated protein 1 putativ [Albugo laibachii Nc14]|eukprot:CCA18448.1 CDK5 regulatory subunitassociated protein 1 putativ [Albugo laibachii Nc14]